MASNKSALHLSPTRVQAFQQYILTWYRQHQRDLPWRKTRDPYSILVSEVMLQQTQVSRVIPKYEVWLERFPTVQDLAAAPVAEVLRYWSGLGYNRRALNLQKAAKVIVQEYHGEFPSDPILLQKLPGLGKYTASAIACFAFDAQIPVIDTNIRKVITYEFFEGELPEEKVIEDVAQQILPKGKAYAWNQALMDYSALMMKGKKIPVAKQSSFRDSNRYYRGAIIRLLLERGAVTFSEFVHCFEEHNPILESRLEEILSVMQKEGLIVRKGEAFSLPGI